MTADYDTKIRNNYKLRMKNFAIKPTNAILINKKNPEWKELVTENGFIRDN